MSTNTCPDCGHAWHGLACTHCEVLTGLLGVRLSDDCGCPGHPVPAMATAAADREALAMSSRDCDRCARLEAEVRRLRIQARRDFDELDDAQARIRVLRRAVYRLAKEQADPEETP